MQRSNIICFHSQTNCSLDYPVCGVNGDSYGHQCAALADHVLIDYLGTCKAAATLRGIFVNLAQSYLRFTSTLLLVYNKYTINLSQNYHLFQHKFMTLSSRVCKPL